MYVSINSTGLVGTVEKKEWHNYVYEFGDTGNLDRPAWHEEQHPHNQIFRESIRYVGPSVTIFDYEYQLRLLSS